MTLITGKRTTQKCKKNDLSVERDFSNKNSVHTSYQKMTNSIFAFGKKKNFT